MMFLKDSEIVSSAQDLIQQSNEAILAVAFWGKGAADALRLDLWNKKSKLKILCNLESGAVNPNEIDHIISLGLNIEIRTNPKLHAKVYWTEIGCIIGSANASANGLHLEGSEVSAWHEACCLVNTQDTLYSTRQWLQNLWEESKPINSNMLKKARLLWKSRRADRLDLHTRTAEAYSLLEYASSFPDKLRNRNIYISTYLDEDFSPENEKQFIKTKKERHLNSNYERFEGWDHKSKFPPEPGMILLSFGINDNEIYFDGLWQVPKDDYVIVSKKTSFTLVKKLANIKLNSSAENHLKLALTKTEQKKLITMISSRMNNNSKIKNAEINRGIKNLLFEDLITFLEKHNNF